MNADLAPELLAALSANCGAAYVAGSRPIGRPWRVDDELMMSDAGLPIELPPNNATVIRPPSGARPADELCERVHAFFSASPGGGYEVWSIWPTLDLSPFGFARGGAPCMVREPGGEPPPAPPELEVAEVHGDDGMRDAWSVMNDVFCDGLVPEPLWDARVLGDEFRFWVGRVDGRPVTTSCAFVGYGFVGVYCVATLREARGCGYGEAVTWPATLCRPDLPATLQASPMGRPVYERMGYRTIATFTVWGRERGRPTAR